MRIFEVEHSGTSHHLVGQCGPAQSSLTAVFAVKMIGNDSPRQPLGCSSMQCSVQYTYTVCLEECVMPHTLSLHTEVNIVYTVVFFSTGCSALQCIDW